MKILLSLETEYLEVKAGLSYQFLSSCLKAAGRAEDADFVNHPIY